MKEWLAQWGLGESTIQMVIDYGIKVVGACVLLYLGSAVGKALRKNLIARAPERFDQSLVKFAAQIVRWSVFLLAFLACLSLFGIETTSFAAVIGGASVAIGLALLCKCPW